MEAQSAGNCRGFVDLGDSQIFQSKPSTAPQPCSCASSFETVGYSARRCRNGICSSLPACNDTYMNLHQGHQHSAIRHGLHCKEYSARRAGRESQGLSCMRHRIRTLPSISRYLYPSDEGMYTSNPRSPQWLIFFRPSSSLWPESTAMRYPA